MYYFIWAIVLGVACLLSIVTGLRIERKLDDDSQN